MEMKHTLAAVHPRKAGYRKILEQGRQLGSRCQIHQVRFPFTQFPLYLTEKMRNKEQLPKTPSADFLQG